MKRIWRRVVGIAVAMCIMVTSNTALAAKAINTGDESPYSVSSAAAAINLALGKTATASDVENGTSFTADLAVDGLANTRWASNPAYGANKTPKWLKVDLGESVTFDTVEIKFEQTNIIRYKVEVSEDDSTWTPVYESDQRITSADQTVLLTTPATGKFIRVYVTEYDGSWPSVSIYELAVYHYAGGGDEPAEPTGNYNIYPIPQKVTDSETVADLTNTINVVKEEGIDAVTKNRVDEVLAGRGLTAQYSDEAVAGKTNLYIGINGSGGAADSLAGVPKDVFAPGENKYDMHVVKVFDNGDIVILGKDTDAAFYGLATLEQMLDQNGDGKLKVSTFEDYSFQKYRGAVEGYYGYPWSVEGTLSWFDFAKRYKMNIFLYGPKTDPYHLGKWDEDYPTEVTAEESKIGIRTQDEMTQFAEEAAKCNVDFVWVAHPAMKKPIDFTDESTVDTGVDRLMVKFDHMYQMGVREFGVFVDDIDPKVIDPMATKEMQAYMIDQVQKRLYETYNKADTAPEDLVKNVFFTPVTYATSSSGAASYLPAFKNIHEDIEVCFTGNNVFSSIRNIDATTFKNWIGRTPVLWWNYPVNDNKDSVYYTCPINYYYSQDPNPTNLKGVLSNPMNFSESSKVAFFGVADYTWNPGAFDAVENWNNCFEAILPGDPEMSAALKVVYGSLNNEYEPAQLTRLYTLFDNGDAAAAAALKDKMYEILSSVEMLETLKQSEDPVRRLLVEEAQTSINKLYDMAAAIGGAMAAISSDDPLEQIHGYYLAKAAHERLNIVRNPRYEIIALEGAGEDIYYNILQAIPSDNKMKGFVTTAMNQIADFTPPTVDAGTADIQELTINPSENLEVQQGTSRQFTAAAVSSNTNVDDVIWSIEGAAGAGTKISYNGVLTVDNNELSPTITVKAVSAYDSGKIASVTVTVTDRVYIDPTIPVNLGPAATVLGGSGNPESGQEPENALDDNEGTKWCPGNNTRYNQWMAFDLGAEKRISKWQMVHAGVEDVLDISSNYSLQIIKDPNATPEQLADKSYLGNNNNWTTVAQYTGNDKNVTNYLFEEPVTARYFRLFVADGCQPDVRYPATRIFECRVYGVDKAVVENTYSLTIDPDLKNGTLETDAAHYEVGAKVNVRVFPEEGYQLKEGSLKANSAAIEGRSFIMPQENVTITAEFESKSTPSDENLALGAEILGNNREPVSANEGIEMAFDGDESTKWCAEKTPSWIVFDIKTPAEVNRLRVVHASGSTNPEAEMLNTVAFALQVLDPGRISESDFLSLDAGQRASVMSDESYWTDLKSYINNNLGVTDDSFDSAGARRIYRMNVTDGDNSTWLDTVRIYEIQLFGNGQAVPEYSITIAALENGTVSADKQTASAGETVTLTVTPNPGYRLAAGTLKANGEAVEGNTFEMPAGNVTVTAQFERIPAAEYSITIAGMENGTVSADKQTASAGETVTLTVTPNPGYRLAAGTLKANGEAVEGNTFEMPAGNVTVTAQFERIPATEYSITIAGMENGTVSADKQTASAGETVTLTVTPNPGYRLAAGTLKANGEAVEGNTFEMPAGNVTVTAQFERIPATEYSITIAALENGTVSADKQSASAGETVTLTVTPNPGYRLVAGTLKANGEAVEGNTFEMPAGDVTITAVFQKIPSVVTAVLEIIIARAEEMWEDGVFEGTMQAVVDEFKAALEAARNLAADPGDATQEEINAATVRLLTALTQANWKQGDTTLLEITVEVAQAIGPNLDLYLEPGKQAFVDALKAARDLLLISENAWDDDLQEAALALIDAMSNLRMKPNKDILNDMINSAKGYDLSEYTEESANAARIALIKAEALAADENASQADVDAAVQSLRAALNGLVANSSIPPNENKNTTTSNVGDGSVPTKTGDPGMTSLAALALLSAVGVFLLRKKKS